MPSGLAKPLDWVLIPHGKDLHSHCTETDDQGCGRAPLTCSQTPGTVEKEGKCLARALLKIKESSSASRTGSSGYEGKTGFCTQCSKVREFMIIEQDPIIY